MPPKKVATTTTTTDQTVPKTNSTKPLSPMMRAVRAVRTFEPRVFLHKHVFGIYWSCMGVAFVYANYKQHLRMKKLYPDYNQVAKSTGTQFSTMKEQELMDVRAFNAKAEMMRVDLKQRLGN
jgi:hypothetical protein